ncbi:MAG TPA: penicillin-binding protein 1C [bacterium]|nr:penicillin-binding protein 1C [bacterium]
MALRREWKQRSRRAWAVARPALETLAASRKARFFLAFLLSFKLLDLLFPLPLDRALQDYSTVVSDTQGVPLRIFSDSRNEWRLKCRLEDVSEPLRRSILYYEDRWFYWHPGINPFSLIRAFWTNHRAGKVVCGGSTLTMQVARLLEPKERTYSSKALEVLRALQLEWHLPKDRIFELYLNLAPYGGNLVGVRSACLAYFHEPPSRVSYSQAALLTVIPKSPNGYRLDRNYGAARFRRDQVLHKLAVLGALSPNDLKLALREENPVAEREFPFEAPHFTDWVKSSSPRAADIRTPLDRRIQSICQSLTERHLRILAASQIHQAAVVVMDNKTAQVLAMVGSGDFQDDRYQGQVNGALASRSPGSTLKPLLYALAMDKGMITPRTLLEDVPISYDGYQPSNFDGKYAGVVSARNALAQSLNVPAVILNHRLGPDGLYTLLARDRVRGLNPNPYYYGLPIVLGACEVSLVELCEFYSCLARGGDLKKASFLKDLEGEDLGPILSPGACYLVSEILTDVHRPDFPDTWESLADAPKIAWKTGTSYGYKDAWSIGYNSRFTVGVWTGNFTGEGSRDLVGGTAAAPLLFHIFRALDQLEPGGWFRRPDDVGIREVCALSGAPPGQACSERTTDYYLKNVSSTRECTFHQMRKVDALTGELVCSACEKGRKCYEKPFEVWPAWIATWLRRAGYPLKTLPPHASWCQRPEDGSAPHIHSPEDKTEFSLRPGIAREDQKILLLASVYSNVKKVYWLVDGKLAGSGPPEQKVFYVPAPGKHRVVCLDDAGRSSTSEITILQ